MEAEADAPPTAAELAQAAKQAEMRAKIMAIIRDTTLTEAEKAVKKQQLMMGGSWQPPAASAPAGKKGKDKAPAAPPASGSGSGAAPCAAPAAEQPAGLLDDTLACAICLSLCERPITAPCQHNFCLTCFNKWTAQGKKTCPTCRSAFPAKFAANPRINTALAVAIRLAKNPVKADNGAAGRDAVRRMENEARPDEAFVTARAVKTGRANASSGRIMVTVPGDHFGPIGPESDPVRNKGVCVGDFWKDRLDCRQWGAHFPHVAGIAGQSGVGAQSVVLSGGYQDDRDEGEWFLYTGSGGRDLSGNKRTSKVQSKDQTFESMNKALMQSCIKGFPVRVVRSYKEKRSTYAPTDEQPVRYDGIYRILRCWRKEGMQGPLVCRYLFMRCDNTPAPWSSEDTGDEERLAVPAEAAAEIKLAQGKVVAMDTDSPYWAFDRATKQWGWSRPQPPSQRTSGSGPKDPSKAAKKRASDQEKALKEFQCGVCHQVLQQPLSTPCGHHFCKGCLDKKFMGIPDTVTNAGRAMRVRRVPKPCPACKADICEFLAAARPNTEMAAIIAKLQAAVAAQRAETARLAALAVASGSDGGEAAAGDGDEEDGDGADEEEDEEDGAASGCEDDDGDGNAAGPSAAPKEVAAAPSAAAASGAAAVAAPAAPQLRWSTEVASLYLDFPEFDRELIRSMVDDQGGDDTEVRFYLKRMSKAAAAARSPTKLKAAARAAAKKAGADAAAPGDATAAAPEQEAVVAGNALGEEPAAAREAAEEAGPSGSGAADEATATAEAAALARLKKGGKKAKAAAIALARKEQRGKAAAAAAAAPAAEEGAAEAAAGVGAAAPAVPALGKRKAAPEAAVGSADEAVAAPQAAAAPEPAVAPPAQVGSKRGRAGASTVSETKSGAAASSAGEAPSVAKRSRSRK